jgi:hypothetical protein
MSDTSTKKIAPRNRHEKRYAQSEARRQKRKEERAARRKQKREAKP